MSRNYWTKDLDVELLRRYPEEGAIPFARDHGIEAAAVSRRAHRLDIKFNHHKPPQQGTGYSEAEDEIIRTIFPIGGKTGCAAELPHRSTSSIHLRATKLGLKFNPRK